MKLKKLLRENRENIESITVNNELITYFSSDVKVLDLIEGEIGFKIEIEQRDEGVDQIHSFLFKKKS